MKKYILFFAILFATTVKAQSIDTVKSAIQVNPTVVNAILKDTAFQVTWQIFSLTRDSSASANSYVQVFDRKAKKLFDLNITIPASILKVWVSDVVIDDYILSQLSLTKK